MARIGECTVGCGACCQFLVLQVNPHYMEVEHVKKWIELHGISLSRRSGGVWAQIPLHCSALTEEGKCSLYGMPERPLSCDTFPQSQADIDLVDAWIGEKTCSYNFEEVMV